MTDLQLILMQYRNSISLHLPPSPPRSTDQVGDWRKRSATMHRLAADLLDSITDNLNCTVHVMDDERVVIERCADCGCQSMDAMLAAVIDRIEDIGHSVCPGHFNKLNGCVEIDPDFLDEMVNDACPSCGSEAGSGKTHGCADPIGCGYTA